MPMKIDNEKLYDLISGFWRNFRNSTEINKCIVDFLGFVAPNRKILDVGFGTGLPIAKYAVKRSFAVTGIDISQKVQNGEIL